jgi:tetratricopeptide (TPR) repeat protein
LASGQNNRGLLLSATGRLEEAAKDYDEAILIQKQLAADFPNQPDLRNELAATCVNLGKLHLQQKNWAEAKRVLLEGRPHHLATLRANSRHPTYRQFYRSHLVLLTAVHAGLLEKDDALGTAAERRDLGWDPPTDAYDAASFLSRCIPIAALHDKLDDKRRADAAHFYAVAAMTLLRDAVDKGFEDAAKMREDVTLAPLHPLDDFQKLVVGLEHKGK